MAPCYKHPVPRAAASLARGFLLSSGTVLLWNMQFGTVLLRNGTCSWLSWIQLGFSPSPLLNPKGCFVLVVFILSFLHSLFFSSWLSVITEMQGSGINFPIPTSFS